MTARNVVAVDLGAESGRVVLGRFDGSRVALEELHRFPTPPRHHDGRLRWDLGGLWSQIQQGLATAGAAAGRVDAVGVDAWGWTTGSRRDGRRSATRSATRPAHQGLLEEAHRPVGRERLYLPPASS